MHLLTIIIRKKAVEIVISGRESKSTTLSDLEQSTNIGGDVTDIVFLSPPVHRVDFQPVCTICTARKHDRHLREFTSPLCYE
jgi:hypothetical protein